MTPSLLFDARLVLEKPTGIGRYISELLPPLLQTAPDLHVHLLRRARPWPGYGIEGWAAPNLSHHVSDLPHMSPRQHLVLPRLAQRLGASLIHYPHFDAPLYLPTVPVVATLHDATYLERPEFFERLGRAKRGYMRWSFGLTLRRAAARIAVSRATAIDLGRRFGTPLERFDIIYEAAADSFRPLPSSRVTAVRAALGLERPYLLSVGERRPHKNYPLLIRAFAGSGLAATHDLVIVGRPHAGETGPEQAAAAAGISHRVRFLERVDQDALPALYSGAVLFVLVSLYEGFGLPLLEAMAAGAPVVASSTTATGEIGGQGAHLVDPEDEAALSVLLADLAADPEARERLAARGRRWVSQFSWRRAAEQTVAVYRRLLEA